MKNLSSALVLLVLSFSSITHASALPTTRMQLDNVPAKINEAGRTLPSLLPARNAWQAKRDIESRRYGNYLKEYWKWKNAATYADAPYADAPYADAPYADAPYADDPYVDALHAEHDD